MTKPIKKFVIDACVARAAGNKDEHPASERSRNFFESIRDSKHLVVFNKELSREWNIHQSGFARRWRATMVAKRKVEFINLSENAELRYLINEFGLLEKILAAVIKDIHLIELALHTDKIIISLDNKVRKILCDTIEKLYIMNEIIWINPTEHLKDFNYWFKEGANTTTDNFLANWNKIYSKEIAAAYENIKNPK